MSATTLEAETQIGADHADRFAAEAAHEYEHGCTLTRRQAMQAMAAATATIAASNTVMADDDDEYGVFDTLRESIPTSAKDVYLTSTPIGAAIYMGATAPNVWRETFNTDPTAERISLWHQANNEITWLNNHFINFGNRMEDSRSIASLEARHGMALAWEDGEGANTMHDTAHQRIRQYYELPEFNHFHAGNKALAQLSYLAGAGQNTDPTFEFTAYAEDDEGEFVQCIITDSREHETLTLHDGTVLIEDAFKYIDHLDGQEGDGDFITPVLQFRADDEETVLDESPITQDVIDSWDGDEVTFDLENGTYTTNLRFACTTVSDGDDTLPSQVVFDGPEWLGQHQELKDLSDDVVAWYEYSFVEDIKAELDAGNITPEQVRSPEGMARFLAGTDDVESERFRISWMQQFGFERTDLTEVRGMAVTWNGAIDTVVDTDPDLDDRHVYPNEFVEDQQYSGVVFGDSTTNGMQAGGKYAVGTPVFTGGDGRTQAFDQKGDLLWENTGVAKACSFLWDEERRLLYIGNDQGEIVSLDPVTGEHEVMNDDSTSRNVTGLASDGQILYAVVTTDRDLYAIDLEDHQTEWHQTNVSETYSSISGLELSPDETTLFFVAHNTVRALDASDGTQLWQFDTSDNNNSGQGTLLVDDGTDLGALYAIDHAQIRAVDTEEQAYSETEYTERDVYTFDNHRDRAMYAGVENDRVVRLSLPDLEEEWVASVPDQPQDVTVSPCGTLVYAVTDNGEIQYLDAETGDTLHVAECDNEWEQWVGTWNTSQTLDGSAARAIMFDETITDDEDEVIREGQGQVDLWYGVLEIDEMWDAGGANITHVDDDTLDDIIDLNGTPGDIDTIIDEMDEFDDVSDIKYTRHVLQILEFYDETDATVGEDEGSDVVVIEPDWTEPDYDTFDSTEFVEWMQRVEDMVENLEDEDATDEDDTADDDGDGGGFLAGMSNRAFAGVLALAAVALAALGGDDSRR
ncbi:PQQ-binding-like beta-propeller repeat protein [Natronosalvus vescus]|uniref:outer membrane protein assembly factor BamB family protein n=1 Tax=Natronosalvus vescus TaxID=2953881 RepID=UPI0020911992|nr:PQQ-binding-like beta-propeller repeat protein [Natronosalvus vescus]